jgi:pyruvate dehydrogenase E1 component
MYYKESSDGQILQEGITEAGAFSSWIAAATSYANSGLMMIPFYIFYSMFGFQRIGDEAWAAGDMRARGFLIGGTAGRTTLNGEGLQHEDGHSHLLAGAIPNCVSYDPTFAHEIAVIFQDGLRRMYAEREDVYYYITVMNENYQHPEMPDGCQEGIIKGMYLLQPGRASEQQVQLLGSGTILNEALAAAAILAEQFNISANVWSVTSFNELRKQGHAAERHNRLHADEDAQLPYVTHCLQDHHGPIVAATDYVRAYADQIRGFLPGRDYIVLGTDGFGRSDTRANLRRFFEVDSKQIAYAALYGLYRCGKLEHSSLLDARSQLSIDPDKPNPPTV